MGGRGPEDEEDGFCHSYCNTIPTPEGGTHEAGLRNALTRGIKAYGELIGNRRIAQATGDDVAAGVAMLLSLFMRDPQFQGQTKERLASAEATRLVEGAVRDHFDHWLERRPGDQPGRSSTASPSAPRSASAGASRRRCRARARRASCGCPASSPTAPATAPPGPRSFSSRATAPAARPSRRATAKPRRSCRCAARSSTSRAPRPTRCAPIRNSPTSSWRSAAAPARHYREETLRYERVIIMTDADVDGAHIASLLMTFFFREMAKLVDNGHLFLALPPLYRLTQGEMTHYARDDAHREELLETAFTGRGKVEISRFKGLGEMPARYLGDDDGPGAAHAVARDAAAAGRPGGDRNPGRRVRAHRELVETLMGRRPELRFDYIQKNARFARDLDV